MLCIVAKWCVLEQKLPTDILTRQKSIGIKMNELDFCLEVV